MPARPPSDAARPLRAEVEDLRDARPARGGLPRAETDAGPTAGHGGKAERTRAGVRATVVASAGPPGGPPGGRSGLRRTGPAGDGAGAGLGSTLAAARAPIAAFAAMGCCWGSYAATFPALKAMLGVTPLGIGLLVLGTPVAAVFAMLLAPRIGAALGRFAVPLATLGMALAFVAPGHADLAGGLMLGAFVAGMAASGAATGTLDVLMNARVAALENARGGSLMNLCHAAYSFGYAGSAILCGMLREAGWQPGWVMTAAAGLAAVLSLATWERDGRIVGLGRSEPGGTGALGPATVIGGLIVLIAFLSENAAESWSALHIETTLHGDPRQGAMGPAALALTMGFARLGGQGLAARIGAVALLTGGAGLSGAGALIAAAAPTPGVAYAGFVVMGVGASVVAPTAFTLVGRMAPPGARARAVARATLLGYLGYFIGPSLFGLLAGSLGLRVAFAAAALALISVPILARAMARQGGG